MDRSADLLSYDDLPFDSDLFGCRIARLHKLGENGLLKQAPIDCFYLTCLPSEAETIARLAQPGYLLTDIRLTLRCSLQPAPPTTPPGPQLGAAIAADVADLKTIARTAHQDSRFYFDPHFERSRCDRLYDIWIEKSCNGYADQVLVVRIDGRAVGYVTCHLNSAQSGHIGLLGVAAEARGGGLGTRLVEGAVAWFAVQGITAVDVVTQGRNVAAQRLYQKSRFRTQHVELFYHLWPQYTASPSPPIQY